MLHSNNAVARALALMFALLYSQLFNLDCLFAHSRRLFGATSKLLYSRQQVLQALLDALESNDPVELYAAIGALERFLSISTVACVASASCDGSGSSAGPSALDSARDATADTDWPAVLRGVLNSLALFVQRIRSPMHLKLQIVPLFRFSSLPIPNSPSWSVVSTLSFHPQCTCTGGVRAR